MPYPLGDLWGLSLKPFRERRRGAPKLKSSALNSGAFLLTLLQPGGASLGSMKFEAQFAADGLRGAHQGFEGHAAAGRIEQAVELRAARVHQGGHARLGETALLHCGGNLTGNDALDGGGGDLRA